MFHGNFMSHENHYKLFIENSWPEKKKPWKWNICIQGPEKCFPGFLMTFSWDFHNIAVHSENFTRRNIIQSVLSIASKRMPIAKTTSDVLWVQQEVRVLSSHFLPIIHRSLFLQWAYGYLRWILHRMMFLLVQSGWLWISVVKDIKFRKRYNGK